MRTSLLIIACNEGESLWKTIRSCVETCGGLDYEIIVADDSSTDGSVDDALHRYPQVRVVRHPAGERQGVSPTRRLAAAQARGEAFVFLDGHCNLEPGAIRRLVDDLVRLDGWAIVTPRIPALDVDRWVNRSGQVGHGYGVDLETLKSGWLPLDRLRPIERGGGQILRVACRDRLCPSGGAPAVRRAVGI